MRESKELFQMPNLPESPSNPMPLQPAHQGRDTTPMTGKNGVTNAPQRKNSPVENNGPPGFSDPKAQRTSGSPSNSYIVRAPDALQPVQWSRPTQTSTVAQTAVSTITVQAQHSNPIQRVVPPNNMTSLGQPSHPTPTALANTCQQQPGAQYSDIPPPPLALQVRSYNEGQPAPAHRSVTMASAESSSLVTRFAAATQGASQGNLRTHPPPYPPSGFLTRSRPISQDSSSEHDTYNHSGQEGDSGYGTQFYPPHAPPGGGGGTSVLPMSSSSIFLDLNMNAHLNNYLARQKQRDGPVAKPRGRPRGSRKRQPPPQWEESEYELHRSAERSLKHYQPYPGEWNELKLSGRVPGHGNPAPGEMRAMAYDGGQGWDYSMMKNNIPGNNFVDQGQRGDFQVTSPCNQNLNQDLSGVVENMPTEIIPAMGTNPIRQHPPVTQFGNDASSENGPSSTSPLPSNCADNNRSFTLHLEKTTSAVAVGDKGKQQIEDHSLYEVKVQEASCNGNMGFGNGSSQNMEEIGRTVNSFSLNSRSHHSNIEPAAAASNINQIWNDNQSTYINFENVCIGAASAQGNSSSNKHPQESNTPTMTNQASLSNNEVPDHLPISVNDYFVDYEPVKLTDDDYITCALREPPEVNNNTAQQTHQGAAFNPTNHMQSGVVQQISAPEDFQTNTSQQLTQQANSYNDHPSLAPQPYQSSSAQFPVQDGTIGSSSVHQIYTQNNTIDGNNIPEAAYQVSSSKVPANPTAHQLTSTLDIPRNLGPTAYYYQQQQQQANSSANGPRPYYNMPPLVQHHQASRSLNRQQQYYQYGERPTRTTRRRRQNPQPPRYSAMDFNQCAITPTMFNEMVHDGSADLILGSELWPGLNQDVFNMMVMADPTLLNPARLQEHIKQINSGMVPIPDLLNSMRMNPNQTGFSTPPAANRSSLSNYGASHGMTPNPIFQQGPGEVGADAVSYNPNNIQYVQNQQPQNLQRGQMNANMQQGQKNFENWQGCAAPSSSHISEEILQPVPMDPSSSTLISTQENVSHNFPFSSSMTSSASVIPSQQQHAAPLNTRPVPNVVYNPMFGAPYANHMRT